MAFLREHGGHRLRAELPCLVANIALIFGVFIGSARADENLIVHRWSIFTILEDESGKEIGGVNVVDVPLAETLHKIAPGSLLPVGAGGEIEPEIPRAHSEVTRRIEKAVVNFYPTRTSVLASAAVEASDGWLTQFYPTAIVTSPGYTRDHVGSIWQRFGFGSLSWNKIAVHSQIEQLAAVENQNLEEENPSAARIEVGEEEADGLIYRGVAHDHSFPLRVIKDGAALRISEAPLAIPQLWLVETRADGNVGLRVLHPFDEEMAFVVKTAARLAPEEWSPANLDSLDALMRPALRQAGLFAREADALLATLRRTHSRRNGLRLFFLAPSESYKFGRSPARVWVLDEKGRRNEIESTSVTVGCIELVTPEQRALLATIAAAGGDEQSVTGKVPQPETLMEDRWQQLYEMYGWLGQFRNALLLDEQERRPSAILEAFIRRFHLEAYTPESELTSRRKHAR